MPDLTGIDKVEEFYSQHYVDELLLSSLKEIRKEWREGAGRSHGESLRGISRDVARAMREAARFSRAGRLFLSRQERVLNGT